MGPSGWIDMGQATPVVFRGSWRITEMDVWRRDAFETLGPAHFTFREHGGRFRFVCVEGDMDCRFGERDGRPLVEFSWSGNDENDEACGRGWAIVDGEMLTGRIFIHFGDDSAFKAKREATEIKIEAPRRRKRRST